MKVNVKAAKRYQYKQNNAVNVALVFFIVNFDQMPHSKCFLPRNLVNFNVLDESSKIANIYAAEL